MKQISIRGKNNIYKCLKANLDENAEKCLVRDGMHDINEIPHKEQFEMIRKIYMREANALLPSTTRAAVGIVACAASLPTSSGIADGIETLLLKEQYKKISGYKCQDKNKDNKDTLITLEEVIEKLVASKLKCFYCSCNILVIYKNVREPTQWTLDRKDNGLCHSCDNTLIACLKCNLQRRVTDMNKFNFTKKLLLKKI